MSPAAGEWDDPRVKFWSRPYAWRHDSSSHVFLARAVHQVGKALFPETWTGQEPVTQWMPALPQDFDSSTLTSELERAQRLLFRLHDDYRARVTNPTFLPIPSPEEWAFARVHTVAEAEQNWPIFSRFYSVTGALRSLFEAGQLPTGVRDYQGGPIFPLHPSYWNGESVVVRFNCCQMDPACPFSWEIIQDGGLWIYVERQSLDRYLKQPHYSSQASAKTQDPGENNDNLSEYVRFMIEQSRRLGLSPDNQIKHASLMAELDHAWGARKPELSGRLLEAMATLMRSPESQSGKRRRKSKG